VSILFISESGPVPSRAGRNSGSAGVAVGDAAFFVCDDARPAVSSKPIAQKIPSRMAK